MAVQFTSYKTQFLETAISSGALTFGSFTLKSGRVSPYFFNAGNFYRADLLRALTSAYAKTLDDSGLDFDIIFGPAYKGIPLCAATVDKLADLDLAKYGHKCYSFDRKEAKDHGEGGNIVGAPLKGKKVLIIDDVVTAGTAKREAIDKIRKEGGIVVGILIALDRMEKLPSPDGDDAKPMPSAIGQIRSEYGIPVLAILTLDDIVGGLEGSRFAKEIANIEAYRSRYRASDA